MSQRGSYNTRQRGLIESCLEGHRDRYVTVREIGRSLDEAGSHVGSTTLYRNLERMVEAGVVLKFTDDEGVARYCLVPDHPCGQLVCMDCGSVRLLECGMLGTFAEHVRQDHAFVMDPARTVLLGHCDACCASAETGDKDGLGRTDG